MSVHQIEAPSPAWLARLSPREAEVLACVARGGSNAEVAQELFISVPTVKTHLAHLIRKTGVRDRVQLVVLAWSTGFVSSAGAEVPDPRRRARCLHAVRSSPSRERGRPSPAPIRLPHRRPGGA